MHAVEVGEAIDAIVTDLKPWQQQWCEADIRKDVAKTLESLRFDTEHFLRRDAKAKTRSDARAINKTIIKLKRQLWQASPELQARLALPLRPKLFGELFEVEAECGRAVEASKNETGRRDTAKEFCARIAYVLIAKYSKNDPTSGSKNSPFRGVAGSLYSYCAQPNEGNIPDLERACEAALHSFRDAGIKSKKEIAKEAKATLQKEKTDRAYRRRIAQALDKTD